MPPSRLMHAGQSLRGEPAGRDQRADAVVAVDDQRPVARSADLVEPVAGSSVDRDVQIGHRRGRRGDGAVGPLVGLADVEQDERFAGVEPLGVPGGDRAGSMPCVGDGSRQRPGRDRRITSHGPPASDRALDASTRSSLSPGQAEVAEHVPPDAVDVVGVVLGVVELDLEGRPLDLVAVGLVAVGGAEPGEADVWSSGLARSRRARRRRPRRACRRRRRGPGP